MNPIYNGDGWVVAWLEDDEIYNLDGQAVAFITDENVISYQGKYLGKYRRGFIRDPYGNAVAFTAEAKPGPILPAMSKAPVAPVAKTIPLRPDEPTIPEQAIPTLNWSNLDWAAYLAQ